MKIITKSKLPKWAIASIPFREEEKTLSGFIVPFVIFSVMGMGVAWYEFYEKITPFLGILMLIFISVLVIAIMRWMITQFDILRILRLRLEQHYKTTENEKEKLETKERLSYLCVKVWHVEPRIIVLGFL